MSKVKTYSVNPGEAETAQRIASLTGKYATPERWYRHKGEDYWYISAGFAWPNDQPGAIVVVGIKKSDPVTFHVLDAVSAVYVSDLFKLASKLKKRYESDTKELLQVFFGDWDRFSGLMTDFNIEEEHGLYLSPPPDYESPVAGLVYWLTIDSYLSKNNKKLFLNNSLVASEIKKTIGAGIQKKKTVADFHPQVMALGMAVHAMRASRYWETNASQEIGIPTHGDILAQTAHQDELVLRELFGDTGDPESDDGRLIPTI